MRDAAALVLLSVAPSALFVLAITLIARIVA
jgi:hypothetical protein